MHLWTERVPLQHLTEQPQSVRLREPSGLDELSIRGVDTRSAVQLLDSLREGPELGVARLSASDRDRLLAAFYRALWGDRIVSSLDCDACGAVYDLSFELSALQRQLAERGEAARVVKPRTIADSNGSQLHLPDADEEEAAAERGLAAGSARLLAIIAADSQGEQEVLCQRLERLAPLIDVDLETKCAECGEGAVARFDLQSFALQRLLDERETVLNEVHALAGGYGWSLPDILALPRSLRRSLFQRCAGSTS
jgi:hypothetical protein